MLFFSKLSIEQFQIYTCSKHQKKASEKLLQLFLLSCSYMKINGDFKFEIA